MDLRARITRPSSCAAGKTQTWTGTCESVWKLQTWTCAASQLGRISSLREQRPPNLGPLQRLPRCLDAMMMRQIQVLLVRQAPAMSADGVGLWPEHGCDRGSVALPDCHLELLSPRLERGWPSRAGESREVGGAGAPSTPTALRPLPPGAAGQSAATGCRPDSNAGATQAIQNDRHANPNLVSH